jgi:ATP-dependent exoDNAse (exonuclease V) alpha subunit
METFYQKMQALKQNPATANAGSRWSAEEVGKLLNSIKANKSMKDIAIEHQRTEGSIVSKLLTIGESYVAEGKDIKEVAKMLNVSVSAIQELIEKNKDKPKKKLVIKYKEDEEEVKEPPKVIVLTEEQQGALNAFKSKKNLFLTGVAGAGKSVTLKRIVEYANKKEWKIGVTATTGSAAFLIGGRTLHSFLGIGIAKEEPEVLLEKLKEYKNFNVIKKLRELDVLVIDEVSMLDNILFDKISKYISLIRKNEESFGGLRLVFTGDFCQLEPVENDYCFKSEIWKKLDLETVYLTRMIRQDDDKTFQKMLLELRYGICSDETLKILKSLNNTEFGEIKPTKLYSHNIDVDKINQVEYAKLIEKGAKKQIYQIKLHCLSKDKEKTKKWVKNMDVPDSIELCEGAQIVVLANLDQDRGIVNGTRGVIESLKPNEIIIKLVNKQTYKIPYHKCTHAETEEIGVSYIPLKLAYALTIHKSQGMTLDAVEIDIGKKIFAAGQAYTALSRARNLKSVKVIDVNQDSFITRKSVVKLYKKLENKEIIL